MVRLYAFGATPGSYLGWMEVEGDGTQSRHPGPIAAALIQHTLAGALIRSI